MTATLWEDIYLTAPLFLAMSARDSHTPEEVGPQLVPFSRPSSPPGPLRLHNVILSCYTFYLSFLINVIKRNNTSIQVSMVQFKAIQLFPKSIIGSLVVHLFFSLNTNEYATKFHQET